MLLPELNIITGADCRFTLISLTTLRDPSRPRARGTGVVAAFLVGAIQPACAFVVNTSIRVPSLASTNLGGKTVGRLVVHTAVRLYGTYLYVVCVLFDSLAR